MKSLRLLQHPDGANHGKGAAVRLGMLAALGTYRIFMDADNSTALDQITANNVAGLKEVCRVRVGDLGGFGPGPIVVNNILYVTAGNATVAMNPVDCGILWKTIYTSGDRAIGVHHN